MQTAVGDSGLALLFCFFANESELGVLEEEGSEQPNARETSCTISVLCHIHLPAHSLLFSKCVGREEEEDGFKLENT